MLPCLKDLEAVKAYIAAQAIGNAGDQDDEDDVNTVINGEIPLEEENVFNQGGDVTPVPSPYALQGTLEDPLSLSSLRDRVTKSGGRK